MFYYNYCNSRNAQRECIRTSCMKLIITHFYVTKTNEEKQAFQQKKLQNSCAAFI
jgi:hypothetical protein